MRTAQGDNDSGRPLPQQSQPNRLYLLWTDKESGKNNKTKNTIQFLYHIHSFLYIYFTERTIQCDFSSISIVSRYLIYDQIVWTRKCKRMNEQTHTRPYTMTAKNWMNAAHCMNREWVPLVRLSTDILLCVDFVVSMYCTFPNRKSRQQEWH